MKRYRALRINLFNRRMNVPPVQSFFWRMIGCYCSTFHFFEWPCLFYVDFNWRIEKDFFSALVSHSSRRLHRILLIRCRAINFPSLVRQTHFQNLFLPAGTIIVLPQPSPSPVPSNCSHYFSFPFFSIHSIHWETLWTPFSLLLYSLFAFFAFLHLVGLVNSSMSSSSLCWLRNLPWISVVVDEIYLNASMYSKGGLIGYSGLLM